MKKKLLFVTVALFSIVLGTAIYAGAQDFTAVNKTSKVITHIYVSQASKTSWDEDVLGAGTVLEPGASVEINFDGHEDCQWDFKAVDANGGAHYLYNANLCQLHTINITN